MPVLHRDYESRSVADLKKVGARRYAADPTTCVLCICYAVDDGPIESFVPEEGKPIPDVFAEAARNSDWLVTAHNAPFEYAIDESVLGPRFDWPQVPIERHVCTMALARYHGFPGELGKVAVMLGLPVQKDAEGRRLMLQLCKPRKARKGEDKAQIHWVEVTPEKLARLIEYCKTDVAVERALHHRLPPLPCEEARLWVLDHKINAYGFRADLDFAAAAVKLVEVEKAHINTRITELTDGAVTGFTKVNDLREFVNARGHTMKNFDADAVAEVLKGNPDATVRELLELRQASNNPAVAKYVAVLAGAFPDQRIRGSLSYYGTHTGRWTGSGLNVHNLPREDSADALESIEAVRRGDLEAVRSLGPPIEVIGRLARGVVVAPPRKLLLAGDFSMIEPRVASWLAEETWKLDTFREFDRTGDPMLDAHRVVGAQMQGKPVDPTDNTQRQRGKTVHMALNYGGGVRVWRDHVPNDPRSDGEIKVQEIKKFQKLHPKQTNLMYALEQQALQCVHRRDPICGKRHAFEMDGDTLILWLPSGRPLFYPRARLEDGRYDRSNLVYHNPAYNADDTMWYGAWLAHLVSATSRDLLVNALFKLDAAGFDVILHVHDEIVTEIDAGNVETTRERFKACMTDAPTWAKGLPFNTKVRVGPRYIKTDSPAPAVPTATIIPIRPEIVVPPRPAIIKPSRPAVVIPIDYTRVPVQPTIAAPPPSSPPPDAETETETEIDLADLIGDVPKDRKICCPFHDETKPSLHVYPDHYFCFGCRAYGDHIDWLRKVEGLSLDEAIDTISNWDGPVIECSAERDAEKDAERTAYALGWWIAAKPMTGRPAVDGSIPMTSRLAARYLADIRGIDLDVLPDNINDVLRFHNHCVFGPGVTHPCLVALMRDPITGEPTGIQRTALTAEARKIDRRMLGPAGVVKLWPASKQLVIGEGLETTLAAATRLNYRGEPLRPAWATLSDGAMARFPVIDGAERLIILADNDINRAGQIAAEECKQRWLAAGRRVALLMPERPGTDFNDIVLDSLEVAS